MKLPRLFALILIILIIVIIVIIVIVIGGGGSSGRTDGTGADAKPRKDHSCT